MLENMALISSITNEWSQQQHRNNTNNNNNNNNQLLDEKILMAAASNGRVVPSEKQQQIIQQEQQQQQQQQALKCPRCDSSNTKFCYYNNYSLSQPRHFCKACKRYWTRGGTLRNVPVGGGCRKNKRVKRPTSSSSSPAIDTPSSSSSAPTSNPNPSSIQSHHMDHHMSSVFYGLQTNPSDHLSYSRFNPRVSNVDTVVSGFDLQPQLSALGLGFSSEFNGFNNPNNTSNSLLSSYPMFGSSAASSNSPTMASLLPSSSFQQQQKYFSNGLKDLRGGGTSFHGLGQYQDLQMHGNSAGKEVKMEEAHGGGGGGGGGRIDWDLHGQNQTHHDQINSSDPNLYWNGSGFGGAWLDPANIGSSVPSLI